MLIAVPLGVGLALGLTRWRGYGARPVNYLMLFPLVTPEIVMAVSLLLVFDHLYNVPFGTDAQVLGQVTFSISYVVIIVRGTAALDRPGVRGGGAGSRRVADGRLPARAASRCSAPAIFASLIVVFALSIDDFVVTQYMSAGQQTQTVPILIYQTVRGTATPALNAVASVMVFATLGTVALAYAVYRWAGRSQPAGHSALGDVAGVT